MDGGFVVMSQFIGLKAEKAQSLYKIFKKIEEVVRAGNMRKNAAASVSAFAFTGLCTGAH